MIGSCSESGCCAVVQRAHAQEVAYCRDHMPSKKEPALTPLGQRAVVELPGALESRDRAWAKLEELEKQLRNCFIRPPEPGTSPEMLVMMLGDRARECEKQMDGARAEQDATAAACRDASKEAGKWRSMYDELSKLTGPVVVVPTPDERFEKRFVELNALAGHGARLRALATMREEGWFDGKR